jgi:hypothetical protein
VALFLKNICKLSILFLCLSLFLPPLPSSLALSLCFCVKQVLPFSVSLPLSLYLSVSLSLPLALHLRCALLRPSRQTEKCALPCNNGLLEFWGARGVTYFLKPIFEHEMVPVLGPSFGNIFRGCFHVSHALGHSLQKGFAPSSLKARFWDNVFWQGIPRKTVKKRWG